MNNSILKITDLSVKINGNQILDKINLTVPRGKIITIVGPNGGGKTTLAKCILKLLKPSSGNIWIKPGIKTGYIPQKIVINENLPITVQNFLELSIKGKINKSSLNQAIDEIGLKDILQLPLQKISGGEMQKTLLARALLGKPDLLILDEPAQGIDITGQLGFYKLIERLCVESNISILNISHDLFMVMKNTDYVVCLNRHICCEGTTTYVSKQQDFHKLFGHEALAAFAIYEHHHDHTHSSNYR